MTTLNLNPEQAERFNSCIRMVDWLVSKEYGKSNTRIESSDVRQSCLIALAEAAVSFDSARGCKFSGWAFKAIRWCLSDLSAQRAKQARLTRASTTRRSFSPQARLPRFTFNGCAEPPDVERADNIVSMKRAINLLRITDPRTAEAIELRHRGMTLEHIGKAIGITKERVRQVIARGQNEIADTLERWGATV